MTPWTRALRAVLTDFFFPVTLIVAFIAAGIVVQWKGMHPGFMKPMGYAPSFALFSITGLLQVVSVLTWFRWRQKIERRWDPGWNGWRTAWVESTRHTLTRSRMVRLVIMCLFIPLLLNTFGCWKLAIPWWAGFRWEGHLIELSRAIHGGVSGWHLLQPALGRPAFTVALDRIYFTWLGVYVGMVFWLGVWRPESSDRRKFLLALTLVWLGLGALAATAGASAGPIFLDRVLPGVGAYDEMVDYLAVVHQSTSLMTLEAREILWAAYLERWGEPFTGISAFPSIHVSTASLYVLALWGSGWTRVILASLYALATMVSSVHLGWHYAVDVYAGVLGAIACWTAAGLWLKFVRTGSASMLRMEGWQSSNQRRW